MTSSAARKKNIVDSVVLGDPPKNWKEIVTVKVTIYGFRDIEAKAFDFLDSPMVKAHGHTWSIRVYPRGSMGSSTEKEQISLHLYLHGRDGVKVTCRMTFRSKDHERIYSDRGVTISSNGVAVGCQNFLSRMDALEGYLEDDGSLVIECDIQVANTEDKSVWYPKPLVRQDILVELYNDASVSESSDVAFLVDGTTYNAHTNILCLRCKKLYAIARDCDCLDRNTPIPLRSVTGPIFRSILEFVYTVKLPTLENDRRAADVLVGADRLECVPLKLYAESFIVDKFLTAHTAAQWLLFADSHSCALLKEAATNLFRADPDTVQSAAAWSKVTESLKLVVELLDSVVTHSKKSLRDDDCSDAIDRMEVGALRTALQKANLELDGSRQVLVDRLRTHHEAFPCC